MDIFKDSVQLRTFSCCHPRMRMQRRLHLIGVGSTSLSLGLMRVWLRNIPSLYPSLISPRVWRAPKLNLSSGRPMVFCTGLICEVTARTKANFSVFAITSLQNASCVASTAVSYCNFAIISSTMPHTCLKGSASARYESEIRGL